MTSQYMVVCGCECCISSKIVHSSLLIWRDHWLKHLRYRSCNVQNRRSGEISSCIFETYKNSVVPHGCHIYNTTADMSMAKMCTCTSKYHGLTHWKCVLCCCDRLSSILLPSQESIKDTTNTCPEIILNVYCNVSCFTDHGMDVTHEQ